MTRRGFDCSGPVARLAEVDTDRKTITLRTIPQLDCEYMGDDQVGCIAVPDQLCAIKLVQLPERFAEDPESQAVFELSHGLIDPPEEFLFGVYRSSNPNAFHGTIVRVDRIHRVLQNGMDPMPENLRVMPATLASAIALTYLAPSDHRRLLVRVTDASCGFAVITEGCVEVSGLSRHRPAQDEMLLCDELKTTVALHLLPPNNPDKRPTIQNVIVAGQLTDQTIGRLGQAFDIPARRISLDATAWNVTNDDPSDSPEHFLAAIGAALS